MPPDSLQDAELDTIRNTIYSRGHWFLVVHPATYVSDRIPYSELVTVISQSAVGRRRNWGDYPWINPTRIIRSETWIGCGLERDLVLQAWKLYQSGQCHVSVGLFDDWLDRSQILLPDPLWEPQQRLGIARAIVQASYALEFASRLGDQLSRFGVSELVVSLTLRGLASRQLWMDIPGRIPLLGDYRTAAQEISFARTTTVQDLLSGWSPLALECVQDIFQRFGWSPPATFLEEWQQQYYQ